jgi:flagellar basal body-associated protein FliL
MDDFYSQPSTPSGKQTSSKQVLQSEPTASNLKTGSSGVDVALFSVLYLIIFLVLAIVGYFASIHFTRKHFYNKKKLEDWNKTVILEIAVPKESSEQAQKDGGSKRDDKDVLAVGEQIFSVLSEFSKDNFKTWLFGGQRFSLEIINLEQETRFWLGCNNETAGVVERQILAVYPKANIQQIKSPTIFKENSLAYAQELDLGIRYELPFKTYKNLDLEPLNSITNTLLGMTKDESAAIQLILTPVKEDWQKNPRVLAAKIQQGQNPKEILFPDTSPMRHVGKILKEVGKEIGKAINPDKKDPQQDNKERKIDLTGKEVAIQLTPQQQEIIKKLEEKSSKSGFQFTLRIIASAPTEVRAKMLVDNIIPSFQIYENRPFNYFKKKKTNTKEAIKNFILRAQSFNNTKIINTEEVNSIWHLPNYLTQTANIKWLVARKPPVPLMIPGPGDGNVFIGRASSGATTKDVYIKTEDRLRHIYALGGTGTGKSQLMGHVILEDIKMGNGVCVVDPHGELIDDLMLRMRPEDIDRVILFSPSMSDFPLGLNMLETDPKKPTEKTLVIDMMFSIWDKLYDLKATGGPMFEQYMKNAMRLVMSHPESGSTLMEIGKVLTDEDYRTFKLAMCDEQEVVDFWEKNATQAGGEASLENMVPYITSKLAPFTTNDFLRPMIGQQKSSINFRSAMDNKKILLLKLEKSLIGEGSSYLLGMVIIGSILRAGMGRADGLRVNEDGTTEEILASERTPFFVYIDEMQNFLFDAIPQALEEIRKYKLGFYLAHQFVKQVINKGDERIKDSIMNNCANKFIYRVGAEDAKYLEAEFAPEITANDLMNPEVYTINARILVNGQKTPSFNFSPENLISKSIDKEMRKQIIEYTKKKYGRPRAEVEEEIRDRGKLLF